MLQEASVNEQTAPVAESIEQFCIRYGISRGTAFRLLREGRIARVKVGTRTLIPTASAESWWASISGAA